MNAALYYLAHLLETGDLVAVNRRLLVIAYEDIGLADPSVGTNVLAAVMASERLGLPEARIPLGGCSCSNVFIHKIQFSVQGTGSSDR